MSKFSTRLVNILIYLTIINFTDLVFFNRFKSNVFNTKNTLKFFSYQEITDFRYFRNMISILISQLYFDVILFNQKF